MTRGAKPVAQKRSAETRDRILQALERLLREQDFDQLSVSEIASEAGVSVGTVYRRFENKEAFLPQLVERDVRMDLALAHEVEHWQLLHMHRNIITLLTLFLDESEGPGGEYAFALSDVGALLQTGVAGQPSLACGVTHWVEPPMWGSWGQLEPALRSGGVPFAMANGDMIFDYYAKHPESAKPFNEFMSFFSGPEVGTVVAAFDWGQFEGRTVVDVGGSLGPTAAAIKAAAPGADVICFDLPEVTAAATEAPLPGVEYRAGDMFDPTTLPQADCVFMKHILHDWSDADSERILASVRQSLRPGGRLVLAEAVLPRPGEQSPLATSQKMIDVLMLTIGGKERTAAQWGALVGNQGFRIAEVVATDMPMCQLIVCELE